MRVTSATRATRHAFLLFFLPLFLGLAYGGPASSVARAQGNNKRWTENPSTRRVALVLGNAAYQQGSKLLTPVQDAERMAAALKALGFEVILLKNGTRKQMVDAIDDFGDKLTSDCIAFAFYSGYALQADGVNYLLPIDFRATTRTDVVYEAISANRFLARFAEARSPMNLVVLDACRSSSPFRSFTPALQPGLAKMEAPRGTLIAYADAPGSVAEDSAGSTSSLFTTELLKGFSKPGVEAEAVFQETLDGVATASGEKQLPWMVSSLPGELYLVRGSGSGKLTGGSTKARLKVTSNAAQALVQVEGRSVAAGIYVADLRDEGKKRLEVQVSAPGYESKKVTALLERGKVVPLMVKLLKEGSPEAGWRDLLPASSNDLAGWKVRDPAKNAWRRESNGVLVNAEASSDLYTLEEFGDIEIHAEYRLAPGGNSGLYLRGRYEIQLYDDPPGKPLSHASNGALYSQVAPSERASRPAGEWQTIDVRLVGQQVTVVLNGRTIIDSAPLTGPTGPLGLFQDNGSSGPLLLQGRYARVEFRALRVRPLPYAPR